MMAAYKTKKVPDAHPVLKALRRARIDINMTQMQLAEKIGYTPSDITRIERHTRSIRYQMIVDYASYFGFQLMLDAGGVDLRAQRDAAEGSANDAWRHAAAQSLASYPAVAILRARWLESAQRAQAFATDNPQTPEQWRAYGAAETQFALADELDSAKHLTGEDNEPS